ncbi:unnamed protein product [Mytilus edulis]|uniref:Uncharacterized protein n=1 Tax=Mytilus edulis TaxID=6550 RepID=A0A8S3TV77_MYTED|nr:unnamed protein product [Mytilus edulis]
MVNLKFRHSDNKLNKSSHTECLTCFTVENLKDNGHGITKSIKETKETVKDSPINLRTTKTQRQSYRKRIKELESEISKKEEIKSKKTLKLKNKTVDSTVARYFPDELELKEHEETHLENEKKSEINHDIRSFYDSGHEDVVEKDNRQINNHDNAGSTGRKI